jgi:hypothetical protein
MRIHRILVCVQLVEPHHVGIEGVVMENVRLRFGLTLRGGQPWLYCLSERIPLTGFDS